MTVQQPKAWNSLIVPPRSWADRRRTWKLCLPLYIFIVVCLSEMIAFRIWWEGAPRQQWSVLLAAGFVLIAFLFLIPEVIAETMRRSKRILKLRKRAVWIQPANPGRVPWKQVLEWQFEPVPNESGANRITLVFGSKKHPRKWPILLGRTDRDALFLELAQHNQNGVKFQITEFDQPVPVDTKPVRSLPGLWLVVAAWALLIHATPLLTVGLIREPTPVTDPRPLSENAKRVLTRIAPYFSSVDDLRGLALRSGLALATTGLMLSGLGVWRGGATKAKAC